MPYTVRPRVHDEHAEDGVVISGYRRISAVGTIRFGKRLFRVPEEFRQWSGMYIRCTWDEFWMHHCCLEKQGMNFCEEFIDGKWREPDRSAYFR